MRFLNTNKKKNLLVFFFAFFVVGGTIFFVSHSIVNAEDSIQQQTNAVLSGSSWSWNPFKTLLYGLFVFLGFLVSVAVTIFGWVINPDYISGPSGLLNQQSIYELWQFVRDFFNIFFIFSLLYIAFTTVFQIQKNFKKAILTLVLAALFVNFSYPVTRVLIDATNVPMYFFANQMLTDPNNPGESFGTILKVSGLQGILLPERAESDVSRLLAANVFIFLFGVTLLVIAVMFVIRLLAFVVLLVFSSVGFVAFIVPGLKEYSDMWWKNFWKYALFGPASMLMLLVATRFLSALGDANGSTFGGIKNVATGITNPEELGFVASMAMFSIPIIMLWFTIGLGQKMSLAGAASISGKGEKFAKWAGKKTYDNPLGRGLGGGIKQRAENNKFAKLLTPKYWKGPSSTEAAIKGGIVGAGTAQGIRGGARSELDKIHAKKVRDAAEEHKKNKTSHSQLVADLTSSDRVKSQSAALALAQNDDIRNTAELTAGLTALRGNAEMTNEFVKKAQSAIQNVGDLATALAALGDDSKAASSLIDKAGAGSMNMNTADYRSLTRSALFAANPNLQRDLDRRMKKEGQIQTIVDHQATLPGGSYDAAYTNLVADMSPDDLASQNNTLHNNANFVTYVTANFGPNDTFSPEHRKDVFAKLSGQKKASWARNGIHP